MFKVVRVIIEFCFLFYIAKTGMQKYGNYGYIKLYVVYDMYPIWSDQSEIKLETDFKSDL